MSAESSSASGPSVLASSARRAHAGRADAPGPLPPARLAAGASIRPAPSPASNSSPRIRSRMSVTDLVMDWGSMPWVLVVGDLAGPPALGLPDRLPSSSR